MRVLSAPRPEVVGGRSPSLAALLTAAERALEAEVERGLRAAGYEDLRAAHAQVFVVVDPEGSHLTMLAGRAGMTKQAMAELVRHLQHRGYLQIDPDPRDRRAKIIRPTALGERAQATCLALADRVEERLAELFGADGVRELRMRLRQIAAGR
jgi:DNA-binding MarR family transcriptional regulator